MSRTFDSLDKDNMTMAEVIAYERVIVEREKVRAIESLAREVGRIHGKMPRGW